MAHESRARSWPELSYAEGKDSLQAFHRWLQIAGKIRLSKLPWINHSWQTPLYLTSRGLTTSLIHEHDRAFSIDFDLIEHRLSVSASDGKSAGFALGPESTASFYGRILSALGGIGIHAAIDLRPNELPDATPFPEDTAPRPYDPDCVSGLWDAMLRTERVMQVFRSRFVGKVSPVHLFWGSLDLAVTRFSGRRAPEHPGGVPHLPDLVTREAYSHEVSSCGFWPGDARLPAAAFYSYAYPEPAGFKAARVTPQESYYHSGLREFILPYEEVRSCGAPEPMLLDFFQSTYEAAADLGGWDREALEDSRYLRLLQLKYPGSLAA